MPATESRLSAGSSQRIREALTEMLLQERARQESQEGAAAGETARPGPWDLLIEEGCTWRARFPLSRQLFCDLREHFGSNVIKEILLAAAGVKVSRTCLSDAKLDLLRGIARHHGFEIGAGSKRYIHRRDIGKGGSSNSIERVAGLEEEGGLRNVYIATDSGLCEAGEMLEEAGDDEVFGTLLGIPACCREAFVRLGPLASTKQNDFVLPALDNTDGEMPYDSWVNYPANYFGPGLMSFFPCSFVCSNAAAVAKSTFEMLSGCDAMWANSFLEFKQTNILYTEYAGLHLFRRPLLEGSIRYGAGDYCSTERSSVSELISRGSRLEVCDKHKVIICRGTEQIASLDGADTGMCAFH